MATIAAAVIGAGATYYGVQQQKKMAKKAGAQQDRLYGIQADTAEQLQPYAQKFYQSAWDAYQPTMDYYKSLAGNDVSKFNAALSPQFAEIGRKYANIRNASRALNPRGGRSASYNLDLAYKAGDEKQALINSERSGAWQKLIQLAGMGGDLGAGAAGISTNAAGGAGQMLNSAWLMQSLQSGNQAQAYADIGKSLVGMFGKDATTGKWYVGNNPGRG